MRQARGVTGAVASVLLCTQMAGAAHSPCAAVAPGAPGGVDGLALGQLLGHWTGSAPYSPCPPFSAYDFNEDCRVNGLDLAMLLAAWGTPCSPVITQLAGNPLVQYPWFEYVRAFNQGSPLRVAIDPTRFPQLVGVTADIYIVAHKTAAVWAADPELIDVTSGGLQTQTFTAGSIQANTFTIAGGDQLNGTLGALVGVGYDAVIDVNRNGELDATDFIDATLATGAADEAGLYIVRDVAAPGPYAVTELNYAALPGQMTPGSELENTFYPSTIDSLGQVPLVIISHGNGHNYQWYGHLGNHLASYGYVVMSHENATGIGVVASAADTFGHINEFVREVTTGPTVAPLQPLVGRVDVGRIALIGHSRGGEGVVIVMDQLFDGALVPTSGWSLSSLKLVSSIAPTNFLGVSTVNPHSIPYHLWTGDADVDVNGCAASDAVQTFQIHERGEGYRQSTSLDGVGHADFHTGGTIPFAYGPCLIGKDKTHAIMRGYMLPMLKHYFEGDIPSKDFLWRQWESFKPIGAPPEDPCPENNGVDVVVNLMYKDSPAAGNAVIDDFQTQPSTTVSSSGGSVSFTVSNLIEDRADDANQGFVWSASDPMNGMTIGGAGDVTRVIVFDWTGPSMIEWGIVPALRDFSGKAYLSLRACQGTRHPNSAALLGDLTFDVVLRDGAGRSSRINIGAYGGGVEEPYQREQHAATSTLCGGGGFGWANEFETIRIRLSDFLNNAPGGGGAALNLSDIVAVRFEFASPASPGAAAVGRLGLDDIELTTD